MKKETKDLTTVSNSLPVAQTNGLLLDTESFELAQRVATMLSKSSMVPKIFQGEVGNCVIALNFASRSGLDPFMIMQKMFVIHGKPSVEAQLQIAMLNASGRYSPLEYKLSGSGDTRACVVTATRRSDGKELEGPEVSIKMAKAEGWYGKPGSKWQTLPELMLRYRAASFFIRLYSPETTMGFITSEEAHDIAPEIEPVENGPVLTIPEDPAPKKLAAKKPEPKKPEPKKPAVKKDVKPDPDAAPY